MKRLATLAAVAIILSVVVALTPSTAAAQSCWLCSIVSNGPVDAGAMGQSIVPLVFEKCYQVTDANVYGQTSCSDGGGSCSLSGDFCEVAGISAAGTSFYASKKALSAVMTVAHATVGPLGQKEWTGCKGTVIRRDYSSAVAAKLREETTTISL
ncbi:MAG TPA: hypothetical protein VFT41_00255 [Gemmatimonadaceae bacterium]|nr:hypothetical protein [Gemmatimonadaceae bacterium]